MRRVLLTNHSVRPRKAATTGRSTTQSCIWISDSPQTLPIPRTRRSLSTKNLSKLTQATPSIENSTPNISNKLRPSSPSRLHMAVLVGGGMGMVTIWAVKRSATSIEMGEVGVVEEWGRGKLLYPGWHWISPLARLTKFNIQPQPLQFKANCRTQAGLFVDVDLVVVYSLDPDNIHNLYMQGGHLQQSKHFQIEAIARSILQTLVAKRTVDEVHKTHQLEIAQDIQKQLQAEVTSSFLKIDKVVFHQVALPTYFTNAIQELHQLDLEITAEKRKAQQRILQARSIADSHKLAQWAMDNKSQPKNTGPSQSQVRTTNRGPTMARTNHQVQTIARRAATNNAPTTAKTTKQSAQNLKGKQNEEAPLEATVNQQEQQGINKQTATSSDDSTRQQPALSSTSEAPHNQKEQAVPSSPTANIAVDESKQRSKLPRVKKPITVASKDDEQIPSVLTTKTTGIPSANKESSSSSLATASPEQQEAMPIKSTTAAASTTCTKDATSATKEPQPTTDRQKE